MTNIEKKVEYKVRFRFRRDGTPGEDPLELVTSDEEAREAFRSWKKESKKSNMFEPIRDPLLVKVETKTKTTILTRFG